MSVETKKMSWVHLDGNTKKGLFWTQNMSYHLKTRYDHCCFGIEFDLDLDLSSLSHFEWYIKIPPN